MIKLLIFCLIILIKENPEEMMITILDNLEQRLNDVRIQLNEAEQMGRAIIEENQRWMREHGYR